MKPDLAIRQDLIFDIGLHKGEDTAYYLKKGFRVVAFEADPGLAQQNRERFAADIATNRLAIVEGAVAEGEGKISFYRSEHSVWGTLHNDWAQRNLTLGVDNALIEVDIVNINSVFGKFGVPYYLKLDIEGGEYPILVALQSYAARPRFLSLESEKVSYKKLLAELRTLVDLGYTRFKVVQQATVPDSTIRTVDLNGAPFTYKFEQHASGAFGDDLPGPWLTYQQARRRYLFIFALYRLFGDAGWMFKIKGGRTLHRYLMRLTGKHFPGWYDTHAMLP